MNVHNRFIPSDMHEYACYLRHDTAIHMGIGARVYKEKSLQGCVTRSRRKTVLVMMFALLTVVHRLR